MPKTKATARWTGPVSGRVWKTTPMPSPESHSAGLTGTDDGQLSEQFSVQIFGHHRPILLAAGGRNYGPLTKFLVTTSPRARCQHNAGGLSEAVSASCFAPRHPRPAASAYQLAFRQPLPSAAPLRPQLLRQLRFLPRSYLPFLLAERSNSFTTSLRMLTASSFSAGSPLEPRVHLLELLVRSGALASGIRTGSGAGTRSPR